VSITNDNKVHVNFAKYAESSDKTDTSDQSQTKLVLRFWIPSSGRYSNPYKNNKDKFENWLTSNVSWWSKIQMTNTRNLNSKMQIIEGWQYETETPYEGSELRANDPGKPLRDKILSTFSFGDVNLLWIEIDKGHK
jgi:hypothetical protein